MFVSKARREAEAKAVHTRKTAAVTAREVEQHRLKAPFAAALAAVRGTRPPHEVAVFDMGCGRGGTVAALLHRGYAARGGEVAPDQVAVARASLVAMGHDPSLIHDLSAADDPPPGGAFDLVVSDNVVEHVADLDGFLAESHRLLKPGGMACHLYPSRWRPMEPHVRQPLVHWLPKGWPQRSLVTVLTLAGIEPHWVRTRGMSRREKARAYADYLAAHTHYRGAGALRRAFEGWFEEVRHDLTGDALARHLPLARRPPLRGLLQWLSVHGATTIVTMRKPVP